MVKSTVIMFGILIVYICIYEKWPIDPNIIIRIIISFKNKLLCLITNNKTANDKSILNNRSKLNSLIENNENSENKIIIEDLTFDYNTENTNTAQSKTSINNKRSPINTFNSWYDNSYIESFDEENQISIIKKFNDNNDNDIIVDTNQYNYNYNSADNQDKPIREIYDKMIYDSYAIK